MTRSVDIVRTDDQQEAQEGGGWTPCTRVVVEDLFDGSVVLSVLYGSTDGAGVFESETAIEGVALTAEQWGALR